MTTRVGALERACVRMLYAALGDSITYGYNATSEDVRFVSQVQRRLTRKQNPVNLFVNAKPGWTSRQLVKSMPQVPTCLWDEAKLVTILIGGNDMIRSAPWILDGNHERCVKIADALQRNLFEIVKTVKRPRTKIFIGTLYNPFPNSLPAEEGVRMLNGAIRHVAIRRGIHLVDVGRLFYHREEELIDGYRRGDIRDMRLRGNPIHPNDKGHVVIADAFLLAYRKTFASRKRARVETRA